MLQALLRANPPLIKLRDKVFGLCAELLVGLAYSILGQAHRLIIPTERLRRGLNGLLLGWR